MRGPRLPQGVLQPPAPTRAVRVRVRGGRGVARRAGLRAPERGQPLDGRCVGAPSASKVARPGRARVRPHEARDVQPRDRAWRDAPARGRRPAAAVDLERVRLADALGLRLREGEGGRDGGDPPRALSAVPPQAVDVDAVLGLPRRGGVQSGPRRARRGGWERDLRCAPRGTDRSGALSPRRS